MEFNDRHSAHRFLASLAVGDRISVVAGSRSQNVTVQRPLHRRDGNGFGSWDHAAVTVGFGPGRWNTEITAAALVDGRIIVSDYSAAATAA